MQNSEGVNNGQSVDHLGVRSAPPAKKGMGCFPVFGLIVLTIVISVALTVWFLNWYLFPKRFEPVELTVKEQQVLERKLDAFEGFGGGAVTASAGQADRESASTSSPGSPGKLEPAPYSELGADRKLRLSERELNAILARNTDLADKLAIDLSDDLISARLRLPLDPDFPFFGGKTLKARAGLELRYQQDRPVVILKGISVMGVPIPNAWLGGLKNIDLVSEFGASDGFWKSVAAGVKHVQVIEGDLQIELKE